MAIQTKVKVGYDASAVETGMSKLKRTFAGLGGMLGRGLRQVGIGGVRRLGSDLFGFIYSLGAAIPNEIKRLAEYSTGLKLVAGDSAAAASEVLAMQKAMELSGMSGDMAADTFREFATKMGEAVKDYESEPNKALRDLGLFGGDLKNKSVTDQMRIFANAVQSFKGSQQDLAFIMDRFLGGDLGLRAISFFQNYNKKMEEGRKLTEGFAKALRESDQELTSVFRVQSALRQKFSELALAVLSSGRGMGGSIVEWIEGMDVSTIGTKIGSSVASFMQTWMSDGFEAAFEPIKTKLNEWMHSLGESFGAGIKAALMSGISGKGGVSPMDFLLPGLGIKKLLGGEGDKTGEEISMNTRKTTELLERISREKITAVFQ